MKSILLAWPTSEEKAHRKFGHIPKVRKRLAFLFQEFRGPCPRGDCAGEDKLCLMGLLS